MPAVVLVLGGCVADLRFELPSFPKPGEEIDEGVSVSIRAGGKGLFEAVACQRLGATTTLISSIGEDYFGSQISNLLKKLGIHHNLDMSQAPLRPAGYMESDFAIDTDVVGIIQVEGSKQTYLASRDQRRLSTDFLKKALDEVLPRCHAVLMSLDMSLQALSITSDRAHQLGKPIVLNASPVTDLPLSILRDVDYVISPIEEARTWIGKKEYPASEGQLKNLAADDIGNALVSKGAKRAIITMEDNGCVVVDQQSVSTYSSFPLDEHTPPSSTGARSAFCAGFAVAVAEARQRGENTPDYGAIALASAARRSARNRGVATQVQEMMETRDFIDRYLKFQASSLEHKERRNTKGTKPDDAG